MKKVLLLVATLLVVTGCNQKPTERLETAMEELTDFESIVLKYNVSFEDGAFFELEKSIDVNQEGVMKAEVEEGDRFPLVERTNYFEKDGDTYNFYYLENGEWYVVPEANLTAFYENFFSFEENFENPFTFLRNVEKQQIEVISSNEYLITTEDETLLNMFYPNEEDEREPLEVRVILNGDSIEEISLEFSDEFETYTYTWTIVSINEFTFEVPEEVRNNAKTPDYLREQEDA